jgi:hypothetical protein
MVQNNNNLNSESSRSEYDIPPNLSIGYGIDLPLGKGKHFLSGATGFGKAIVSGWRVNGITTFRSGVPLGMYQVRAGTALSQLGGGGGYFGAQGVFMRPDQVAGCNPGAPGRVNTVVRAGHRANQSASRGSVRVAPGLLIFRAAICCAQHSLSRF